MIRPFVVYCDAPSTRVVLAKARTHNPDWSLLKHVVATRRAFFNILWLWVPGSRLARPGTTAVVQAAAFFGAKRP
jgi:hypothetical protein